MYLRKELLQQDRLRVSDLNAQERAFVQNAFGIACQMCLFKSSIDLLDKLWFDLQDQGMKLDEIPYGLMCELTR